ncbi:MAG TPA: ATP-dependent DNA helicase RecG [Phycisphaerae bacterium]|nr:ATP-dependent DNA helicase RecG [Phycisphaerae bacterium]
MRQQGTTQQASPAGRQGRVRAQAGPHHLSLDDEAQYLPGVGPQRAAILARLGVLTAGDLLEYLPIRHERHEARTVENLDEGMIATVVGQLDAVSTRHGRSGTMVSAALTDNTGRCSLCWFNAGWMRDKLERGMIIRATGRVTSYRDRPQLVNPRFEVLGEDAKPVDESAPAEIEPVYPATMEMSTRVIRRIIATNLDRLLPLVEEWYPEEHFKERRLAPRRWALAAMHRPQKEKDTLEARRRLAYDELMLMQIAVSLARHHRCDSAAAQGLPCTDEIDRRIRRRFPFPLTRGQDRAIETIVNDLRGTRPMNRLLQGDVGCGKTVVALYAGLVTVANRCQVAIMAPTELLAEQHFRSIDKYLVDSRVRYALLVGRLGAKERRDLLARIDNGEVDIVVGTHALIQEDVRFLRLGLVVVDEQHRFGVRQRATIRSKGPAPHYLVMTATPIPRTLAMTVFGDLDVTTIEELPPGRSPVQTRVVDPADADAAWRFVCSRLDHGEQAFVVYPLIDESDKLEVKAATTEFRRLSEQVFAGRSVGLLHGRMKAEQRDTVMADFIAGRVAVLVATTVVEVGIDVPNATCMVIEHADRYGLSQLHQLRGRIGRGSRPGYCLLMSDASNEEASERLSVLAQTTDGFKIAEEDLRLRGPGEMMGTRQHGLPELRVANLVSDIDLLRMAQQDAGRIVQRDPQLRQPAQGVLKALLMRRYRDTIGLLDVG